MKNITKELVDKHGMTLEALAYIAGCSFSSIRNWYRGNTNPLPIYAKRLRRILETKDTKRA